MDDRLVEHAAGVRGFMPQVEGFALHDAALAAFAAVADAPALEVGTYCGLSTVYLGAAARASDRNVITLDHHRGSEENQPGWEWHEPDLVDPELGVMDTLPWFRRNMYTAGLEDVVVAIVADSQTAAQWWNTTCAFVFIDGGHGGEPAATDYRCWSPWVAPGGTLAIHDVFSDPADGGQAPYEQIYLPALRDGFIETRAVGSLRILHRPA